MSTLSLQTEAAAWCRLLGLAEDVGSLEICRAFASLAVAELAPLEFRELPLYCLPTSSASAWVRSASRWCNGWFHANLDLWIRESLPHWHGRGPAVLVRDVEDPDVIEEQSRLLSAYGWYARGEAVPVAEWRQFIPRPDSIERLCGVLTHELAHAIEAVAIGEFSFGASPTEDELLDGFMDLLGRKVRTTSMPPPQLDCHGPSFTRCAAHIDFRLRDLGVLSTNLHRSCAGERFGQRDYAECYAALGDEPTQMIGKSFAEILATPVPRAFADCALESLSP